MLKLGHILLLIFGLCAVLPFGSSSIKGGGQRPGSSTGPYNPNPRPSPIGRYSRHVIPSAPLMKENHISGPGSSEFRDSKQIYPSFLKRSTRAIIQEKSSDKRIVHDCIGKPPCRTTQPLIDYEHSRPVFTENKNDRQKRFTFVNRGDFHPKYPPYSSPDP